MYPSLRHAGTKKRVLNERKENLKVKGAQALIISEGWPTSLYSDSWLGMESEMLMYASMPAQHWRILKKMEGTCFKLIDDRQSTLELINDDNTIAALQGPVSFVEHCLWDSGCYTLRKGIAIIPYCRFRERAET